MKKIIFAAVGIIALAMSSCVTAPKAPTLKNNQDSISYALGTFIGYQFAQQIAQFPVDTLDYKQLALAFAKSKPNEMYVKSVQSQLDTIYQDIFIAAMYEQIANGHTKFPIEVSQSILSNKAEQARIKMEAERQAKTERNIAEFKAFAEANAASMTTTESGIMYKVITMGNGPKPTESDRVKVNYRGTLLDGTEFDSSKGEPVEFGLREVIKGWTEALQLMPQGSKWEIYIPGELAYGPRGAGELIGPMQALVFEVELLEVISKK